MSLSRRLRRQQKVNLSQPIEHLQKALGDLKQVANIGEATKDVDSLVKELVDLRDELKSELEDARGYREELDRQRYVSLRFLIQSPSPRMYDTDIYWIPNLSMVEQRYRSEYDAMRFFMNLVTWAKEAP